MQQKKWTLIRKSHKKIMHPKPGNLIRKSHNGSQNEHEHPVSESHTQNMQIKAWSHIKVRPEKKAESPDQNSVAVNEGKLKLLAQPTTLAPSQHIPHHPPPHPTPFSQTSLSHACLFINLIRKYHKGLKHIPRALTPPLYHLYSIDVLTSSHSPLYILTYYQA
jgi:hypothetical protein